MAPRPPPRQGDRTEIVFAVSADEMRRFAALSGDRNPLHADPAFARARGFAGPVVFGGLLVAQISRLLGNEVPGPGCVWHDLALKFHGPLFVGESCKVAATVTYCNAELGLLRVEIELSAGERRVAAGTAQAGFPPT
jgi:3-hydroxybutyryl-CoA dehydratase